MKTLEDFLKPRQKELFNELRGMYKETVICHHGGFRLVPGEAPIMLLAHLDTVHREPVRNICLSPDGNLLMSPQGIGGDDRCGVYALVQARLAAPVKPWLLFTCDEEIGGVGAYAFANAHQKGNLPSELDNLKLLVEIDRKGSNDAVYYDCDNPEFEAYISSKGFVTDEGSFSDISIVAPELGVAAVNLSSGYYHPHTPHEYINRQELNAVIAKVIDMIADSADPAFPRYKYVERVYAPTPFQDRSLWHDAEYWRDSCPDEYMDAYQELLDLYGKTELENLRKEYGDQIIRELYAVEFGPFYEENQ